MTGGEHGDARERLQPLEAQYDEIVYGRRDQTLTRQGLDELLALLDRIIPICREIDESNAPEIAAGTCQTTVPKYERARAMWATYLNMRR